MEESDVKNLVDKIEHVEIRLIDKIDGAEKFNDSRFKTLYEKSHLELESLDEKVSLINEMSNLAITKAETATNLRLESMNGHLAMIKENSATFTPRVEAEANNSGIDGRLKILELTKANLEGKASQTSVLILGGIAVISFIMNLIGFFILR